MQTRFKFTKTRINQVELPTGKREITLHDIEQPGLQLRFRASGRHVFEVRRKLDGKSVRSLLGPYPGLTIENARKRARAEISSMIDGVHPAKRKASERNKAITLAQCFSDYIESRHYLKPNTVRGYRTCLNKYLGDWLEKPLLNISRDMVEIRHRKLGELSHAQANTTMRVLRAIFEYAHGQYENENGEPIILHNPVRRLSHNKAWYKERRRTDYIKPGQIAAWYEAVNTMPNWLNETNTQPELIRDYLLLIVLTGLRRREAASLRWEWVDLDQRTLTIPDTDTKNGHEHTLPLTPYLYNLLKRRSHCDGEFIFPGKGRNGYLNEPKRNIDKLREYSGVEFTIHGLRRTFITIAESQDIRDYTLKRLLNHRNQRDVTDFYIITDVERLRMPMEKITNRFLELAMIRNNVIPLFK